MMPLTVVFAGASSEKCGLCEETRKKSWCLDWSVTPNFNRTFVMWVITALLFFCHLSIIKGEKADAIIGLVGEAAVLPCNVNETECGKIYFITWTKNVSNEWKRLYLHSEDVKKPLQELANPRRAEFSVTNLTGFLRIYPLVIEDDGVYKCDVTYVQGKCPSLSYATLVLHAPPSDPVIEKDGKYSPNGTILGPFYEEATLTLDCETVGGKPSPEVTWYKAKEELDSESEVNVQKNGASTVKSTVQVVLGRDDLGSHLECHVDNEAIDEPLVTWVEIDMHVGPSDLNLSGPTTPVTAGDLVVFTCTVEGAKPAANVTWYNGSEVLHITPKTDVEKLPDGTYQTVSEIHVPISRFDHMRTFICQATNIVLQSKGKAPFLKPLSIEVLYPPAVEIQPPGRITINESDIAIMYCKYEANPFNSSDVRWFHGDEELEVPSEGKYVPSSLGYPSLTIKNIEREDSGMYSCALSNSIGSGNATNTVEINVLFPPIVRASITPQNVKEGNTISLFCDIMDGNPQSLLRVQWFKNNDLRHETTEREITWGQVTRNFTGNYSCKGENSAGWGERSEEEVLVVNYLPGIATLVELDAPSVKGKESVLQCEVEEMGLPPVNFYRWEKDGVLLATTSEKYLKTMESRVNTTGNYSCAAVNDVGIGPKGYYYLQVLAPPSFIKDLPNIRSAHHDAPTFNLTCQVECEPICEVLWTKDGKYFVSSDLYTIINIKHVEDPMRNHFKSVFSMLKFNIPAWPERRLLRDRDETNYTCLSTPNEVGKAVTSTTHFLVEYPPESLSLTETHLKVVEGNIPEEVECSASSWPRSTFLWEHRDMIVARDDTLTFNDVVTRKNDGIYVCVAKNDRGEARIEMKLDVLYKPECTLTESTNEEGDVILVCTAQANPALINFTWIKDNETLDDDLAIETEGSQSTYLLHSSTDHYGIYGCIVINDIGESELCEKGLEGPAGLDGPIADSSDKNVLVIAAIIGGIAILFVLIIIIIIVIMRKRRLQSFRVPRKKDVARRNVMARGRGARNDAASPAKQAPVTGGENLYQNVSGAPSDRKQNGPPVSEQEGNVMYENMPFHRQGPHPHFPAARMRQSLPADFSHAYQNVTYYRQDWGPPGVLASKGNGHCGLPPAHQVNATSARKAGGGGGRMSGISPLQWSEHRHSTENQQQDPLSKSSSNREPCPQHGCDPGMLRTCHRENGGTGKPYRPDSTDEMVYADLYDDVKAGKLPDPRLKPPLPPKGIGKKPKEPPLPPKTKKGGSDLL